MEKKDITVGMRVMVWDDPSHTATVTSLVEENPEQIMILHDHGAWRDTPRVVLVERVSPFDQEKFEALGKSIQEKVAKATSSLEESFRLLREASQEAHDAGTYLSALKHFVSFEEFENVIEENGWSTSTFWCNINAG